MRTAEIRRDTAETKISVSLTLEGTGRSKIDTGVGFLDHMLTLFAKHNTQNDKNAAFVKKHKKCKMIRKQK